ncbi:filamentous hemagglutinin family N-terminal domain [Beggiatoa alba B18LD]|uniref:Filamentous hemagglutinin family N-terminal domain n=1 Tax=Beggiatoa alba B18LD TaxID=395493 RepID=I3CGY1_9GAMM|nr:filamentous hemagglutinin N-terminal domain-containing protein [Beggiatoa alba]EIJ42874.1 filamentous hemagglutinin family N-terminal domain [Beggiatoa alba B18LD]
MITNYFRYLFISGILINSAFVQADVVIDSSLGTVSEPTRLEAVLITAIPTPMEQATTLITVTPNLGVQVGSNLFYSFKDFNITANEIVNFALTPNDNSVHNIINRVTGGTPSLINGAIVSDLQNGNLFFINPDGVLLGEHAQIGLFSSFHISTADTLFLGQEGEFNARHPEQSILSSAQPSAYGFLTDTPAPINLQDSIILAIDNNISLVGGDIQIDNSTLWAVSKEIALVSLGSHGNISFDLNDTQEGSIKIDATQRGNLRLNNSNLIVSAGQLEDESIVTNTQKSGNIYIYAGEFYSQDSIMISGGVLNITVEDIGAYQINANLVNNEDSGNIFMQLNSLHLKDSFIATLTNGSGDGGDIYITATDSVEIEGTRADAINTEMILTSQISANTLSTKADAGNAGMIYIETATLNLRDGGKIESSSSGSGSAGGIFIKAQDMNILGSATVTTDDNPYSGVFVNALDTSIQAGNAGLITIETNNLNMSQGGLISSSTVGSGEGGIIYLTINGKLSIGDGNTINPLINAEDLLNTTAHKSGKIGIILTSGSTDNDTEENTLQPITTSGILAASSNHGNAGSILINAQEVALNNGFITTITLGAGNAGSIDINANNLSMKNAANISSPTEGRGNGGALSLTIKDTLNLQGGESKQAFFYPTTILVSSGNNNLEQAGQAGQININADTLIIHDAIISSATAGTGNGNQMTINAKQIEISGQAKLNNSIDTAGIYASSESANPNAGRAGEIYITTQILTLKDSGSINTATQNADGGSIFTTVEQQLYLRDGGNITTSVSGGTGNGGNITIQYPQFVVINHGQIVAQATEGNGGNINIATEQFLASTEANTLIDASSQKGISGQVVITSPIVDISGNVISLPSNFLNATNQLQAQCHELGEQLESRFLVHSLQGIGQRPKELRTKGYIPTPTNRSPQTKQLLSELNGQLFVQVHCRKRTT